MKKLILIIIAIFIVFPVVHATDDVEKLEEQLEAIQNELDALDDKHSDFVKQKNVLVRNMMSLEESIRATEEDIRVLNGQISENKVKVGTATLELDAAKQALQETNDTLDARIRVMYMNGSIGYFEVLLESKSFEDLLVRIEMLQRIVTSDTDLIAQMEIDKQAVNDKKLALEEEQAKLISLQGEMEVKKVELNNQFNELDSQKTALQRDIAALEVLIDETNKDADNVTVLLKEAILLQTKYVGGEMLWPVPQYKEISSEFGMRRHPIFNVNKMHTGIDIPAPQGTPIVAAGDGKVIWSNWLSSYGKCVMIDHGGGIVTLYAHNSSLIVKKGQTVTTGQTISLAGSTGNSTGPHLHFEVRVDGEYVDPLIDWLKTSN